MIIPLRFRINGGKKAKNRTIGEEWDTFELLKLWSKLINGERCNKARGLKSSEKEILFIQTRRQKLLLEVI